MYVVYWLILMILESTTSLPYCMKSMLPGRCLDWIGLELAKIMELLRCAVFLDCLCDPVFDVIGCNACRIMNYGYLANVYLAQDEIVVCHIFEMPNLSAVSPKHGLNIPVEEWQKAIQEQLSKVEQLERDYEADLLSKKIHYKLRGEQHKQPGQGILNVADAEQADMIIMGTRGLDVLRRTLVGSVSDYVVRHSRVPVLICPKKDDKSQ